MAATNTKIGLIGVGNMGSAILEGVIEKRIAEINSVVIFDKIENKMSSFREKWNVIQAGSIRELTELSDVIILAVKPQDFKETADEIKSAVTSQKTVISILAGMTINRIKEVLSENVNVVRAMPNLGARVGQSITAITSQSEDALNVAKSLFCGCGKTVVLSEDKFDLVTAISGSGPAYFFYLMERLAAEAEAQGISSKDASALAIQTAIGAGLLAEASTSTPKELRKMVTSKGGTTEAALNVLIKKDFESMFREAIAAARKRGEDLSQS